MSDSRVGGYPMGVTDATIERCYGGACEHRMCGNCRHFCGSDILVDYGYCHLGFERAFDAEAPDRKEGFWRLAKWAVAWLMENLLYCEDECGECENVYDGSVQDSCDNGFLCSVCGCKVEDEEHYRVSGVWNYCPQCGRKVRHG